MLSDFQKRKFTSFFRQLDDNGNGTLEFDDFTAHARFIKRYKGWEDDNENFTRLIDAKRKFWDELVHQVDLNNDNEVSRDEWISFFEKIIAETKKTGKAPEWLTRIFTTLFLSLDLDGDRKIRVDEYGLYLKSIRVGEDPEKVFNLVDSDGNGIIDLDELEDIFTQWVLSDNPDDPGNYFLMGTM